MAKVIRKIVIRMRRPVDITLAIVPASEEGKKPHRIALDRHNVVFCTCKSWRYNGHSCKHLSDFRRQLASADERIAS